MTKRFHKYKLLLDENLPPRFLFPRLNSRHTIKHLVHDLHRSGITDAEVYTFAKNNNYLIITFNRKHFEPLAHTSSKTGIISVSTNLSVDQIDKKITSLLIRLTKHHLFGETNHIAG